MISALAWLVFFIAAALAIGFTASWIFPRDENWLKRALLAASSWSVLYFAVESKRFGASWFLAGMVPLSFAIVLGVDYWHHRRANRRDEPWATQEAWDRRKPGTDLDRLDHPRRETGEL
jgi:hypothetical protein